MEKQHRDVLVEGMSCQHCVHTITAALVPLPGVLGVTVDLETKTVGIDSLEALPTESVVSAIENAGYHVAQPGA